MNRSWKRRSWGWGVGWRGVRIPAGLARDLALPLAHLGQDLAIPLAHLGRDLAIPLAHVGQDLAIPLVQISRVQSSDQVGPVPGGPAQRLVPAPSGDRSVVARLQYRRHPHAVPVGWFGVDRTL